MRSLIFAALAFGTVAAASPTPAAAFFDNYNLPFCITGGRTNPGGLRDCSYPTYAACRATVSGRDGYCINNPFPTPNYYSDRPSRKHRRSY